MPAILARGNANPTAPVANNELQYDNRQDMSPNILAFVGVISALALTSVVLRVYVRRFVLKSLGADDIVMIAAMVSTILVFVCFVGEAMHGLGRHITAIGMEDLQQLSKWQFFHSFLIIITAALVKISICLLLLRLVTHRAYVWSLWFILGFIAVYNTICVGTIVFACIPVAASWDPALHATAKCFSSDTYRDLGVLNSAISMTTDGLLVLLPMPIIWGLQIERRAKIALSAVMSLGLSALVAGAVKTHVQVDFLMDPDRFYHDNFFQWASAETNLGIIAASLPTLRPLMTACFGAARDTIRRTTQGRIGSSRSKQLSNSNGTLDSSTEKSPAKATITEICTPDSPLSVESKDDSGNHVKKCFGKKPSTDGAWGRQKPISMGSFERGTTRAKPMDLESDAFQSYGILRTRDVVTTTADDASAGYKSSYPIDEPIPAPAQRLPIKHKTSRRSSRDLDNSGSWQSRNLHGVEGRDSSSETELISVG